MYACVKGQERIVQMLLDHGADPEVLDQVHILYYNCMHDVYKLFLQER